MTPALTVPLYCLLAYVAWIFLLLTAVLSWRGLAILGGKKFGDFPASVPHGSDAYQRVNRAHLNAIENLPTYAAVILVGHAAGVHDGLFATLAQVFLAARLGQALMHIASGSSTVIAVRFTFFISGVLCVVGMMGLIVFA